MIINKLYPDGVLISKTGRRPVFHLGFKRGMAPTIITAANIMHAGHPV